ncbi:WD40 repeat domain-containing protein [Streptomyces sp. NPDC091280]|uniref:WD40 repeat domain-containing protein n=1 Tax=Streptomyces sp. NPDC091280 TaxID=3365984 RepID=UPI003814F14A
MTSKLPLHSPRWRDLDGVKAEEVEVLLTQMESASASASGGGEAWKQGWTYLAGGLMDDGVVFDGAYAALPHLVEAAAALPPGQSVDFWVDLGRIVTADYRPPVPADLAAGFGAALSTAEQAAVRSLLAAGTPARVRAHLALAAVAFAGHYMGEALAGVLELGVSGLLLVCPECGSDTEVAEFLADPAPVPSDAPELPDPVPVREGAHPWGAVAEAVRQEALGEEWEPFLRVARAVASAGIVAETPGWAVLCLVAGVSVVDAPLRQAEREQADREQARQLMSLTGYFRCWDCEQTWTIADGLAENPDGARPHTRPDTRPDTHPAEASVDRDGSAADADSTVVVPAGAAATRFRRDGDVVLAADGTPWGRTAVFADSASGASGGVDALAVVSGPGLAKLVAGAGDGGSVWLWDAVDGRLVHDPLPGHRDRIRSLTALSLPDGRVLLASGGDSGTVAVWNPVTGQPVREPVGDWPGGVTGMCAATIPDGRTLLVTATPRGAVRLWDAEGGECVGRLNPYGSPIQSIAAVPIAADHTLIAASDTAGRLHVWDPAVDDPWATGAAVQLNARALADADHRISAVAAVPAHDRTVLATADNRGVVVLWDPATGAPIGDALPFSTGTGGSPLITGTTLEDGRTVVVAGTRHGHRLRIWEPETGAVGHIALDVALTCLAAVGADLIVGHDRGVLGLPLTRQ